MIRIIGVLSSCFLLASCASSSVPNYYTLSPLPNEGGKSAGGQAHVLKSIYISGTVDRPQIVVRSGRDKIILREMERWAEPLGPMTFSVLSQDLLMRAPGPNMGRPENGNDTSISVSIDEFIAGDDGQMHLAGRWQKIEAPGSSDAGKVHRFVFSEKLTSLSNGDIVHAMNVLLSRLSDDLVHSN